MKTYLYQILKGVNHLNKHGLFHRDIKPENILIKINGEVCFKKFKFCFIHSQLFAVNI